MGGVVLVLAGFGGIVVADKLGVLPGGSSTAQECAHGIEPCPFCDESVVEEMGICPEHAVPEALCYQCNPDLIPAFKAEGDWCGGHNIPESQCYICQPHWMPEALKAGGGAASLEPSSTRLLPAGELPRNQRPPSPGCTSHDLVIQFVSSDVVGHAGLEFAQVEKKPVTEVLECNAEIVYDGNRFAHLSSRVPAVIEEVKADLGDRVQQGQVLAVVSSLDLGQAKADFLKLLKNVETARLKAERAQSYFERVNTIDVRMTAIEYLEARKLAEIAKKNDQREQELSARGSTSEKDVLDAQAELLSAKSKEDALRKKLALFGVPEERLETLDWKGLESLEGRGMTSEQETLEAQIEVESADAELTAARQRLRILGLTDADIEQVAEKADSSCLLPVTAPFAGVVVERHAVTGEVIDSSSVLFALADTSKMWAVLDFYEEDIRNVRVGQTAVVQVGGSRGTSADGEVTWVSSQVDESTRTLKARVVLDNSEGALRANTFGRGLLFVHEGEEKLIVPKTAVQWEGCCNVVFIKQLDTLYRPRKVRLGYEGEQFFVVEEGVQEGEVIVTTGSFLLKTEILKGSIGAGCCGE